MNVRILGTAVTLTALSLAFEGHTQAQFFGYTISNGAVTITDYHGFEGVPLVIPSSINNLPVTEIGDWAFSGHSLTAVTIPASVTRIGDLAFSSCADLTSVTLGNGVTEIGSSAFNSCVKLNGVTIPRSVSGIGHGCFSGCTRLSAINVDPLNASYSSIAGVLFDKGQTILFSCPEGKVGSYPIPAGVKNIDADAFRSCKLAEVTIPESVTNVGLAAFSHCSLLTSIEMPDSITTVGHGAFDTCTSLTNATLSSNLTSIAYGMFARCPNLASITISGSVTNIEDFAFLLCSSLGSIKIPKNVTTIGAYAFESCNRVTNVTLYNGLISIGDQAFSSCSNLTSVSLPETVTYVGDYAFSFCSSLHSIVVDPLNSTYSSLEGVLFDKNQSTLLRFPPGKAGSYVIPDTVLTIAAASFRDSIGLTNVIMPGNLTGIGPSAFYGCTGLTSTAIPDNVTNIEYGAFANCTGLKSVTFGRSVKEISDWAFAACSNIVAVAIPDSVTRIGQWAFRDCIKLTSIDVGALNQVYSSVGGVLFDKNQTTLIQYATGRSGSYTIPEGVTTLGSSAFRAATGLTGVTIPGSVTEIGEYAFYSCSALTNVIVPKSVTTLGHFAFMLCTGLTGIYFEGDAPKIGAYVFDQDSHATVFYLPGALGWPSTFGDRPTALWKPAEGWVVTSAPTNSWSSVACSADGVNILAAAREGGLPGSYRSLWSSTNSGITWMSNSVPRNDWWSVAMAADGSKLFAVGGNFQPGVYVSTNAGANWTRTIPDPNPNVIIAQVACSADGLRLVAGGNSSEFIGGGLWASRAVVYTSFNSGTAWQLSFQTAETLSESAFTRYINAVASSADGFRLAAVDSVLPGYTGSLFTSTDGGVTWVTNAVDASDGLAPNFHSLACSADGTTLILCRNFERAAILVSRDGGSSWSKTNLNNVLSVTVSAEGLRLAASDGYGVIHSSQDGGATWKRNSLPYHTDFGCLSSSADGSRLIVGLMGAGICISQASSTPLLKSTYTGDSIRLSWIVPSQSFGVQRNPDVTTTNWVNLATSPRLNCTNLQNEVVVPSTATGVFYRLASP